MKRLFQKMQLNNAKPLLFSACLFPAALFAQQKNDTISKPEVLEEVLLTGVRATKQTPVAFTNVESEELKSRNLGQDIPTLLNFLPSVVMTSDAGNGIGYSGIRVRGSDATRINVTINGIPYNDAESHGTFWVNMPDLVSSVENIQVQRGVGTSTNGAGAFGASINLLTDGAKEKASAEIANSYGSYNTWRHNVKFSTGKISDHFEFSGRLSKIKSDGYIDRSWVDMKSYFLQGAYQDDNRLIKAVVFGGDQQTYQAWNGLEDKEKLKNDRTYNTAGEMYDKAGNFVGFYKNETDNYKQDHYQLHWNEKISPFWTTNLAFHYTIGKGFYENYKNDEDLSEYGIPAAEVNGELRETSNVVRQKWLDNDFYGLVFSANYKRKGLNVVVGGGLNKYEGDHFGYITHASDVPVADFPHPYYFDSSTKTDANVYGKVNYQLGSAWNFFGDLQYRRVTYEANGNDTGLVDDAFDFFNPKLGVTYNVNADNSLYLSYARANREPNRNDYENGNPEPEALNDFELGWRLSKDKLKLNLNAYYMRYKNQLVLTGALNDVGSPIRENSGDSYRLGIEADATIIALDNLIIRPSVSVSRNRNVDFYAQRDGELKDLGDTKIAYSPEVVFSNALTFIPIENAQISLLSKYVGEQYMSNLDLKDSKLKSYFINDLNASYTIKPEKVFNAITISALVNNIFDEKYISNGYFYSFDDTWTDPNKVITRDGAGYYPQATRNFLIGVTLAF
ncbi:iron complex outermembrane receptor protein [Mesonia hippocampi]|uniref:Iron complex outermembrane receptor protein n=1 Tax=Mesonia hippocampi TaxID=1628250 RepID=A0A840EV64_9FLAO|nr:TonB-dependent receptor [Mesonia hippocampi]MBB4119366.1 iron complex outermembrane receptor protein [Mesonia hippocampi]